MRIRQAQKIIKRVLSEPIDTSGSELESVYKPTQERLYKLRTYMNAKSRVERFKGRLASKLFWSLPDEPAEISWMPLPADRNAITFDWACERGDSTVFTMMDIAKGTMIPCHMLAEEMPITAEMLEASKATIDRMTKRLDEMILGAASAGGIPQDSVCVKIAGESFAASSVTINAAQDAMRKARERRDEIDREFDKSYYGWSYGMFRKYLKPITRFLFLESAWQVVKHHVREETPVMPVCDLQTIGGIACERFDTIEQIETRAEELRAAGDFGYRIVAELKD
jgi:hypothetical protein